MLFLWYQKENYPVQFDKIFVRSQQLLKEFSFEYPKVRIHPRVTDKSLRKTFVQII